MDQSRTPMPERIAKPCPWCGRTPEPDQPDHYGTNVSGKWGFMQCCGQGPEIRTGYKLWEEWKDAALAAWNERTPPDTEH